MDDAGLSLLVLGCDGSWPGPGGAGSGYLVRSPDTCLLLDAGPGTLAQLQLWADPTCIEAIVITHQHPDHWTDLLALDCHARFAVARDPIPVFAPSGVGEVTRPFHTPMLEWHPVTDGDVRSVGTLECSFHRTDHPVETLAVRVGGSHRVLGYSADSGPGWSVAELGSGLDLVLCEATYTSAHEGTAGHMSGRQAGQGARRAGARRLVITHRWPTVAASAVLAEAEEAFGGPVEQASIGKEFVL